VQDSAGRRRGRPSVVVLGGGLSGAAAAYAIARSGAASVTVIERGPTLGGLAGSFEREGHFYPLGYHHILHRDRTLLYFLDLIGALPAVRWRRVRMLFHLGRRGYDLGTLGGLLSFPMPLRGKVGLVRLVLKASNQRDWSGWYDRSASELLDAYGAAGARDALVERLTRLKFELSCDEVSGAWLGARLWYREGSAPLGYIPSANWTKVLCDGMARLLEEQGVTVRLNAGVTRLGTGDGRVREAELGSGERIGGDHFVSTIPTEAYLRLLAGDRTPELDRIRYSALISVVCATRQPVDDRAYWINLASLDRTAGGIFLLSSLNPTIGRPGDTCVNFVTHLRGRDRPLFRLSDEELVRAYRADFKAVFGFELEPFWTHIARVPMYSPVFVRSFRNPPLRSASWENLYFAGNYRTFPSVASTGTALGSGLETAEALLAQLGARTDVRTLANAYRLRSMPRA
jgi:protoporphyrinogen oxidase